MKVKNNIILAFVLIFLALVCPRKIFALPEGGVVTAGSAVIHDANGADLEISQSTNRAIINWNQFHIGANERVHFAQPDSSAVTLNRITGGDPSSIFGSLTANGSIFLVNPNGVFFGPTATVDVGSLIATTIDIQNEAFLAGNYNFQETGAGTGFVINHGKIKVNDAGFVFFIAPTLSNEGVIAADGGEIVLSARGAADPFSLMINQSGIIEAKSLVHSGGVIRLIASTVIQSGALDVSARESGANGGHILITSTDKTELKEGSLVDADGMGNGNGGNIIVWSDKNTSFNGTLLARGGDAGGNGGAVEVSGLQQLQFNGFVNASAANGIAGSLLIDPKNIVIENGGDDAFSANDPFGENAENLTRIDANQITAITNVGTGVILQANNDITVNEAIVTNHSNGVGGALTLQAGRSILINASITSDDAIITLTANDPAAIGASRDSGPASITMAPATTLNAGGANIVIVLSTGSGVGKDASGAITLDNLTTTSNIKIADSGPGSQGSTGSALGILGASSSSDNSPLCSL